jgi:hypothetical protein
VKYSPVLDPSLAKEVKDSSLTILVQFLFSYRFHFYKEEGDRAHFRRVSAGRVHCLEEISSFGGEEVRYDSNLFSGVFARPRAPFLTHHW